MGRFVYFPPGRKQFYFSENLLVTKEYSLQYKPLKLKARVLWYLINKFSLVRRAFTETFGCLPENIQVIIAIIGKDEGDSYQINQGTEGPERKVTIIRHSSDKECFFYKIGSTEIGKGLVRNEYKVLSQLNGKLSAPKVLSYSEQGDFIVLESSYVYGEKNVHTVLNTEIITLLMEIARFKLDKSGLLITCFSHGDFCPWNILFSEDGYQVIDWEMSDIRPLGYDLFTYIFQTALLLQSDFDVIGLLEVNKSYIKSYFDFFRITDVHTYLRAFIDEKILLEAQKEKKIDLLNKYKDLKKDIEELYI